MNYLEGSNSTVTKVGEGDSLMLSIDYRGSS